MWTPKVIHRSTRAPIHIHGSTPRAHPVPGRGSGGSGAQPREIFYDFKAILKQNLHITRPIAPRWKALIETCQKTTRKGMRMLCRLRAREWARGRVMLRGVELGLGLELGLELGLGLEG